MALSNSADFSLTAVQLIEEAYRKAGIHAEEEPIPAHNVTTGKTALNMMLKTWAADPQKHFTYVEGTVTLVQGQVSYDLSSENILDMDNIRIVRNSTSTPMTEMSRREYYRLPVRSSEGFPTQWMWDRSSTSKTLFDWPTADSALGTLEYTARRMIFDLDANTDDFDLPQEWYEAVVYNLAVKLLENRRMMKTETAKKLVVEADRLYGVVTSFDTSESEGSVYIGPDSVGRDYR